MADPYNISTAYEYLKNLPPEERDRAKADLINEKNTADNLEALKQQQRRDRLQKIAKVGSKAARLAGQGGLANLLDEGSNVAGTNDPAARRFAANQVGKKVGALGREGINKLGQNRVAAAGAKGADKLSKAASNMGAGGEAAIAGAVSGALQGEGVSGVVKSAWSWYVLWFMFGFLTLDIILAPTIVSLLLAGLALIYLDFHFLMSKFGFKIFGPMNLPQKIYLMVANLIVAILPLMFVGIAYALPCATSAGYYAIKAANVVTFGFIQDVCEVPNSPAFAGGKGGGAGATGTFGEINIVLTSAYRPGAIVYGSNPPRPSAHGRGEAFDVALRPRIGFHPNPPDPRISQLVSIGKSLIGSRGDVLDEYNDPHCNPSSPTCKGHIHVEFNVGQCDGTGKSFQGAPTDLVDLNGLVPIGGGDPRVRSCMLPTVLKFFEMAGQTNISEQTSGEETEGD
jgi:hypothetical protein